jgi:hypothetical protein
MELAYQGLFIRLPFEGAVGVEAFEMNASFNDHVTLRLLLLVEEEKIEALIHGIGDGDDIEVYKAEADGLLYAEISRKWSILAMSNWDILQVMNIGIGEIGQNHRE